MRTINVEKTRTGYRTTNVHGKELARFETGNDERDHNDAQMNAHHARFSPTLAKRLGFKKRGDYFVARPFWGAEAHVAKHDDKRDGWYCFGKKDGEGFRETHFKTKNDALKYIAKMGNDVLTTRNILNPEAGDIEISRASKGGCCDPGTERYHSM